MSLFRSGAWGALCGLVLADVSAGAAVASADELLPGPFDAELIEVIDGDTVRVRVRIWLGQDLQTDVRLRGIDTPELRTSCDAERVVAAFARAQLVELLAVAEAVTLHNVERGKFAGRVVADVWAGDGRAVAPLMIATGLARPYEEGARRAPWCDDDGVLLAAVAE